MLCRKPDTSAGGPESSLAPSRSTTPAGGSRRTPTCLLSSPLFQGGRKVDASAWTELCSPKRHVGVPPPGPQSVTSVGNRVFLEVISENEVTRLGPHPVCLVSSETGDIWTQRGGNVKTRRRRPCGREMHRQVKECQARIAGKHQN